MTRLAFLLFAAVLAYAPPAAHAQGAVEARNGMVVAQEARAARIGLAILERGGNAVDAAVATGFAMAVTYPRAGNIGGGGYMVIRLAERPRRPKMAARNIAIDYRETAPAAATREMFLDEKGNADPKKSRDSALAIGVPGTVAGLALAHQRYGSGRLTLAELIAPAIALARDGFPVEDDIADSLPRAQARLGRWPASAKIFLKPGKALAPGDLLVQRDLADTLEAIAKNGARAFYEGPIAEKLAAAVQAAGGIMTADDLKNYQAHVRRPVRARYRGHEIISMPPSSSGGVVLIEMLNVLEGYKLNEQDDAARLHLMIEAMRRAYADRAAYLGDPAVVSAPLVRLMSKRYAAQLRSGIDPERATPSHEIRSDVPLPREGDNTTHFSVIDHYGNAVSNTTTLNFSYGVGLVAEGTGVLLNNELDDFAARPATPNAFGLIGGLANAPGPNKRPLSSMTPTIVTKNGRPVIVTGSPGGSRIITSVLQVIVNVIDRNMDAYEAVSAPRIHHQWSPDRVLVEQGVPDATITALEGRGHKVDRRPYGGTSANTILVTPKGLVGAADPRTRGSLAAGY
ncbi:MAG: gamma-glutamyltransferase [Xanthobacteraceae bacterium]|nr:gamma-glutamyltransferase [Xanthobacteraceae bacterium]